MDVRPLKKADCLAICNECHALYAMGDREDCDECGSNNFSIFYGENFLLGALKWVKKETYDLYHQFSKAEIWGVGNDEVCDKCEEYVAKKLNEGFGRALIDPDENMKENEWVIHEEKRLKLKQKKK